MDIVNIIRENKYIYLTIDNLAKLVAVLKEEDVESVKNEIVNLIKSGDLFLDENQKISISADKGFYKAKITINKKGFGFAQVEGYPDFFIPQFAINGAIDGDNCLVEITHRNNDDIEGKVISILQRNTTHIVGTLVEGKSKIIVYPDDARFPQVRVFKNDINGAQNNDKVWVELNEASLETKDVTGKIVEVLGKANTPKVEQLSIIRAHNLDEKFDEKVINTAKAINQNVDIKKFKNRQDYTEQNVITIDGEDARDFDDALAIERTKNGYKLYVHIADVSNYVQENDPLDKSAYNRGTSVYFPNMVIPMLPKELSNGVCSLQEGKNRLTLSVEIEMDKDCNVLSSAIKEGIIKSSHRMTYTEVQNILNGDQNLIDKYEDVYQDILDYQLISSKLQEQRRARGEIRMNLPEPFILENSNGEIVSIEKRVQDESHCIIESLMVLTNECVAKTFFDLALPFVYRVHEKPEEEKVARLGTILKNMGVPNQLEFESDQPMAFQKTIDKIAGTPKEQILTKMILRSMMKARYDSKCLGHFGLASEFYCHFTSPIRRYPDLLIHRIIKSYLNGVPNEDIKLRFQEFVERASDQASMTEKNADECERDVDDYKKAVYMSKFLGEEFVGIVSGVYDFGIFVELENGIEGLVKLDYLPEDSYVYDDMSMKLDGKYNHYTIGDEVKIVVASTNVQLRQIDFNLAGVDFAGKNYVVKKDDFIKKSNNKNKKGSKKKINRNNTPKKIKRKRK